MQHKGLVLSLLVLGIISRYPILCTDLPNQRESMKVLTEQRMEMNIIVAQKRMTTALQRNITNATNEAYEEGDEVLKYMVLLIEEHSKFF